DGNGINVNGNTTTINQITNNGTISASSGGWNGIDIQNGSTVKTIVNNGTIYKGGQDGIQVKSGATLENLVNNGYISSVNATIQNSNGSGTIKTLNNQSGGTIGGVKVGGNGSKIETLNN
ncbi:hypothetical protein, partial [Campylobacter sp. W0066.2]|uniref:hypothetical protein n=1 Tax=Campylobacter sp. W0066.2 TaxID=2735752 RepID=UPI002A56DEB2|nr:hypothetical protein [Campylobacter sp. W0066.2]